MTRLALLAAAFACCAGSASAAAAFRFEVVCYLPSGVQFSCGDIVAPATVRENNAGARFSFSDNTGSDGGSGGIVLDNSTTVGSEFNSTADSPTNNTNVGTCPIQQLCQCTGTQITNIVNGTSGASGVIGCDGFIESNQTAVEELQNATSAECAIEYVATVNVTNSTTGITTEQNVTFCFSDPTLIDDDDCNDNTAVIVIIIICVLMLLVVLVVGAYYLVHGNTIDENRKNKPKVLTSHTNQAALF